MSELPLPASYDFKHAMHSMLLRHQCCSQMRQAQIGADATRRPLIGRARSKGAETSKQTLFLSNTVRGTQRSACCVEKLCERSQRSVVTMAGRRAAVLACILAAITLASVAHSASFTESFDASFTERWTHSSAVSCNAFTA